MKKKEKKQPSLKILFQRHLFIFSGKAGISFAVSPYISRVMCGNHHKLCPSINDPEPLTCTWYNDCIKTQSSVISCIASLVIMILGICSR